MDINKVLVQMDIEPRVLFGIRFVLTDPSQETPEIRQYLDLCAFALNLNPMIQEELGDIERFLRLIHDVRPVLSPEVPYG